MRTPLLFLTIAGALLASQPASAADAITIPLSTTGPQVPVAQQGFDWDGFYAGVYGVARDSETQGTQLGLGLALGVNTQIDFVLLGAEVSLQGLTGDETDTAYGTVLGRAGILLTNDVLLYAAAGVGWDVAGNDDVDLLAGLGAEVAVTDELSLRAQYLHGFNLEGGNPKNQFTFGANLHF